MGLFELIEDSLLLSNGRPRPADITIQGMGADARVLVKDRPRGFSTFDRPGIPQEPNWQHYRIPEGTPLPSGLAIVKDQYNPRLVRIITLSLLLMICPCQSLSYY